VTGSAARDRWEAEYGETGYEPNREATPFLVETLGSEAPGLALCLAAGAGRNAVYLATLGWQVTATDISATGLQWLNRWARECGVDVESVVTDLVSWEPGTTCWDLVTMVSYLQPAFFPAIRRALRPGGLFLFHTFGPKQLEQSWGPRSAAHLAEPETVRSAFQDWELLRFEEGVFPRGDGRQEGVVRMLARKPRRPGR